MMGCIRYHGVFLCCFYGGFYVVFLFSLAIIQALFFFVARGLRSVGFCGADINDRKKKKLSVLLYSNGCTILA